MKRQFTRREFLKQSARTGAAALSVPALSALSFGQEKLERRGAPKKILIIGAGLTGLSAAYELMQLGHEVTILEAQLRAGGRILTLREPFSDGMYAEAGAARIPDDHTLTLKYARLFNLPLEQMYPAQHSFLHLNEGARREVNAEGFMKALSDRIGRMMGGKITRWQKIKGGNDQLPKAFAEKLADKIYYGAPVVKIEQQARGVTAVFLHAGVPQKMSADRLLCALPFSVLRNIEVSPPFSESKRQAIREMEYASVSRVFLQSRKRFWEEKNLNGFALTEDMVEVWHPTWTQRDQRGIIMTYSRPGVSEGITKMKEPARISYTLEKIEKIYPGMKENFEGGVSKCWDEDQWARGAWAETNIIEMIQMSQPEGRIHFAGEHLSPWPSWMQGALSSSYRVVKEINDAP